MSVPAPCSTCGYQHIPVGEYDHEFAPPTPVTNSKSNESVEKIVQFYEVYELGHDIMTKARRTHFIDDLNSLLQQTALEARLDEVNRITSGNTKFYKEGRLKELQNG